MKGDGDTILRNVGQHLCGDAASLRRIQEFSITPMWKLKTRVISTVFKYELTFLVSLTIFT